MNLTSAEFWAGLDAPSRAEVLAGRWPNLYKICLPAIVDNMLADELATMFAIDRNKTDS